MTRRRSRGPAGDVVPRRSRPGAASRSRAAGHRGMVTVEAAIAVPLLLAVGLLAAGAPGVMGAHIRCADAAREAALMVARDLPVAEAEATVASLAPKGARMSVQERGDIVEVVVAARVSPVPGPLGRVMALGVSGRSVALREPAGVP
jgi:Flp pilus assembly protein TadG